MKRSAKAEEKKEDEDTFTPFLEKMHKKLVYLGCIYNNKMF